MAQAGSTKQKVLFLRGGIRTSGWLVILWFVLMHATAEKFFLQRRKCMNHSHEVLFIVRTKLQVHDPALTSQSRSRNVEFSSNVFVRKGCEHAVRDVRLARSHFFSVQMDGFFLHEKGVWLMKQFLNEMIPMILCEGKGNCPNRDLLDL